MGALHPRAAKQVGVELYNFRRRPALRWAFFVLRGDAADRQFPLASNGRHVNGSELFSNGMSYELTS